MTQLAPVYAFDPTDLATDPSADITIVPTGDRLRYEYLRGIERRIAAGVNPNVTSVASMFISRWDVAVTGKAPRTCAASQPHSPPARWRLQGDAFQVRQGRYRRRCPG